MGVLEEAEAVLLESASGRREEVWACLNLPVSDLCLEGNLEYMNRRKDMWGC
jgi:hypothetical protein